MPAGLLHRDLVVSRFEIERGDKPFACQKVNDAEQGWHRIGVRGSGFVNWAEVMADPPVPVALGHYHVCRGPWAYRGLDKATLKHRLDLFIEGFILDLLCLGFQLIRATKTI